MNLRKLFLLTFVSGVVLADKCFDTSNEDKIFINSLINKMTVEDKVGQIVQGDLDFVTPRDLERSPVEPLHIVSRSCSENCQPLPRSVRICVDLQYIVIRIVKNISFRRRPRL